MRDKFKRESQELRYFLRYGVRRDDSFYVSSNEHFNIVTVWPMSNGTRLATITPRSVIVNAVAMDYVKAIFENFAKRIGRRYSVRDIMPYTEIEFSSYQGAIWDCPPEYKPVEQVQDGAPGMAELMQAVYAPYRNLSNEAAQNLAQAAQIGARPVWMVDRIVNVEDGDFNPF